MLGAAAIWDDWSQAVGMVENGGKQQWAHRDPRKRRQLQERGVRAEVIFPSLTILGMKLTGGKCRATNAKEAKRLAKAQRQTERARLLPLLPRQRQEAVAAGPLSSAQYGWFNSTPTLAAMDRLQTAVHRATGVPRRSSPHLKCLIVGHRIDVRYRVQQETLMATARVVSKGTGGGSTPCAWGAGRTWAGTIHRHLAWTGWRNTGQWTWYHSGIDETISLDSADQHWHAPKILGHILREAWRHRKIPRLVGHNQERRAGVQDGFLRRRSPQGRHRHRARVPACDGGPHGRPRVPRLV